MNTLPDGKDRHPTEEELMEVALDGGTGEQRRHCEQCAFCAETVAEFREVKRRLASLDEKEVPATIEHRILNIARHGRSRGGLLSGVQSLFSNPFLIALAVALVVVLLYFLVASEIFK
jgi:hypothetical protein